MAKPCKQGQRGMGGRHSASGQPCSTDTELVSLRIWFPATDCPSGQDPQVQRQQLKGQPVGLDNQLARPSQRLACVRRREWWLAPGDRTVGRTVAWAGAPA